MTTLADLTEEVLSYLTSYGANRDRVTSLSSGIAAGDLTFTVADGRQIDRGFVEIDSELIAVSSVDVSTGVVTVHPWGRGANGTTAASHTADVKVTSNPRFPRNRVKTEIQAVLDGLYPDLFGVAQDETQTVNPAVVTYELPAAAMSVISVQYQSTGPSKVWLPVTRYKIDYNADTTAFSTGKSLDIYQGMQPGRTIKILYRKQFGTFAAETDTLTTVGVDEQWRDILRMGAIGRLLMGLDPARLELDNIESQVRGQLVQPLQASQVAKQFLQAYQIRVAEERRKLLNQYPTTQVRIS